MAIRAAHGASVPRLARQLLVENLLVGALGGTIGLLLAVLLTRLLPAVLPPAYPRVEAISIDANVVLFALTLSLLAGGLVGVLPALDVRRVDLRELLAEDGAGSVGIGRRSQSGQVRLAIMGGQVAVACTLLVGASLLGRSFVAQLRADRGYDASSVTTALLKLPDWRFSPERRYAVTEQILERLHEIPAVEAAVVSELPLVPSGSTVSFTLRSPVTGGTQVAVQASPRIVSGRFFRVFGMRIKEGRGLDDTDTAGSLPVVVVNRTFARRYLGASALGAQLPMGIGYGDSGRTATVVGVVEDTTPVAATESARPEIFFSSRQLNGRLPVPAVTLLIRSASDARSFAPALRLAVRQADPMLAPEMVMGVNDRVLRALARPRLYAILLGGFASFALLIAAVGLFGVLSYLVAQRSRELALRSILGARPLEIVTLVLRQGLTVAGVGTIGGLALAAATMRSLAALLYGVMPYDGLTFTVVPLAVLIVSAAACALPALQAARLAAADALRS
jgi:predicted permease